MPLGSVVSKATFAPAQSSRCADWFTGVTQQSVTSCPRSYARAEAAQTHTSATRKREMWSQPQTAMMQDEGWEYARRQTVTLTDSRYQLLAFLRALVGEKSKTTFVNSANRELLSPRCHRGHYDGSPTTVGTPHEIAQHRGYTAKSLSARYGFSKTAMGMKPRSSGLGQVLFVYV